MYAAVGVERSVVDCWWRVFVIIVLIKLSAALRLRTEL